MVSVPPSRGMIVGRFARLDAAVRGLLAWILWTAVFGVVLTSAFNLLKFITGELTKGKDVTRSKAVFMVCCVVIIMVFGIKLFLRLVRGVFYILKIVWRLTPRWVLILGFTVICCKISLPVIPFLCFLIRCIWHITTLGVRYLESR